MLADLAGVDRTLEVEATNAGEVVSALLERHPELRVHLFDESGWLRPNVLLFADGEGIRERDQLDRAIGPGGEVVILQSVAGGSADGGR
jgi:molybdopterin converting factor small subunit